jgi:PKD repeat protein
VVYGDVTIGGWTASATRTGAVASVGTPNPVNIPTLAPDSSYSPVLVPFTTGASAGTGTVVLTVTNDAGTVSRSGSLTVTVSP